MGTFLPPYLWAMLAAIELADQVQFQGATGAAQRSAESCPAPSCRAVSMRWLPLSSRRPEWAGAEHGMRLQRPAILRTTDKPPHIAVEQLDPVGELGQVRALLQIQIELDPQHIHPGRCSTCQRSSRPRFALVASDLGATRPAGCSVGPLSDVDPRSMWPLGLALTECGHGRPGTRPAPCVRIQASGHDWLGGPVWSLAAQVRQMRCSKADLEPKSCRQPCLVPALHVFRPRPMWEEGEGLTCRSRRQPGFI